MSNSHSILPAGQLGISSAECWQPITPPARGERDAAKLNAFNAYILTPGFSAAFHAASLGRSLTSIANYRARAVDAARENPALMSMAEANICALRAEDGLQMAQQRGSAQLPYWSRLAIFDYRKRGCSRHELAASFRCSPSTIANVLQGKGCSYGTLSGDRQLTGAQQSPPGKWKSTISRTHKP